MSKPSYDCSRCPGYCCSYDHIEVSDHDIARVARHFELPEATARERWFKSVKSEGKAITVLRHKRDAVYASTCVFLDPEERRCTIYAARPRVCRAYPVGTRCGYYGFIRFEREHQGDEEFIPSA